MNCRASRSLLFGSALAFLSCAGLGAAEAAETVTVQFPSGDRVVGRIIEQSDTRILLESPVLGRVDASATGITIIRGDLSPGATLPAPPAAAPVVAAEPPPAATPPPSQAQFESLAFALLGGFLDAAARSAVQPGWTDWFKGWHGLLSAGFQFEHRTEDRERVILLGDIAKTVKHSEVRLGGFHFTQSAGAKEEIDHTELKLRFRQGVGTRWVLQSENTWTSNPLIFGLEQQVYAGSLHYRLWQGRRGGFQLGPGYVRTDTKYVIRIWEGIPAAGIQPLIWRLRMRNSGWGGQAHLKWMPLSWLAVESDASQATFRNVVPGFNLELTSAKSRVLMLMNKPWTIGVRHEYNRIALRGLVHLPPLPLVGLIPPFELRPYAESIMWLDLGYRF